DTSRDNRRERKKQEAQLRQERSRRAGPWLQKVGEAEQQVEKLEAEKDELEAQMADPDLYRDEKAWAATSRAYEECKRRLERWYERWETAQGKVEEIDRDLAG
ncbi:MAG: ABC transporter C-terminal domain-containing protein, partial [Desulfoprunum sp.]|uniref:ABC transporter C-terminal domain-containing protein n=1 Tax=Desulfoprunum sp. TaxID=2020866 RepID=UPI003C70B35E